MIFRLSFGIFLCCIVPGWSLQGGLTQHFRTWLSANGYNDHLALFARDDLNGVGSYGGKQDDSTPITHEPVIFIHGNSDEALKSPNGNQYETGWDNSIDYFTSKGYSSAELYATTWGPADSSKAQQQTHSCEYVQQLRQFVEAVLKYTGAAKVDLISHSMGVTLGRKVVKGGSISSSDGSCDIGAPLTDKVDTFVGISGGNRGLASCMLSGIAPTCNDQNGYYPGICYTLYCPGVASGLSKFLVDLADQKHYEGSHVFNFHSEMDEILGVGGGLVWGYPTAQIPGQDGEKVYPSLSHMKTKETTADVQYNAVVNHSV